MRSYICKKCEKIYETPKEVIFCCQRIKKIRLMAISKFSKLNVGDFVIMPSVWYTKYNNPDWIYHKQESSRWNRIEFESYDEYSFYYVVIEDKGNGKYDVLTDGIHSTNTRITIDLKQIRNKVMKVTSELPISLQDHSKEIIREYTNCLGWL